jgi:hypothetical protein
VGTAPCSPRSAARRKISAIAGPGDAEISSTASTKAGSEAHTEPTSTSRMVPLLPRRLDRVSGVRQVPISVRTA